MSTVKTKIEQREVLKFLQSNYNEDIHLVTPVKGGEMSQAFFFEANGGDLVIRVNSKDYSYKKDEYAFKNFASSKIPILKIIKMGKFNEELFFAISEKAKGQNFDTLPLVTQKKLLPQLFEIQDAIRDTKIGETGYGFWDEQGQAKFKSWKESLMGHKDDVYSSLEKLYKTTFLEKYVVEKANKRIFSLLSSLPEDRSLVHGDFAGNNAVSDGNMVTGILDWGESMYGDNLYDAAWIEFYYENLNYAKRYKKHCELVGISTESYKERILCYQLRLGTGGLGFFALSDQRKSYEWQKIKLLSLLSI